MSGPAQAGRQKCASLHRILKVKTKLFFVLTPFCIMPADDLRRDEVGRITAPAAITERYTRQRNLCRSRRTLQPYWFALM